MSKSRDTSELAEAVVSLTVDVSGKATYLYSATAPVSPVAGDLWMDTSGASPKGMVWNGSEWKSFSGASAAAFDEGASTGATFSTLTNPDGDGKNYRLATFTGNGSLVLTEAGKADLFLLAGGGSGGTPSASWAAGSGGAGGVMEFTDHLEAATFTVTVGATQANGAGNPTMLVGPGSITARKFFWVPGGGKGGQDNGNGGPGGCAGSGYTIDTYSGAYGNVSNGTVGGGIGSTAGAGRTTKVDGHAVTYGKGGAVHRTDHGVGERANSGDGGANEGTNQPTRPGSSGIVLVRVEI